MISNDPAITVRIPPPADNHTPAIRPILGRDRSEAGPRVVLVDDDARLRAVLADLLHDDGITIVGQAGTAGAALDLLGTLNGTAPLVALVDVRMPGLLNGIELTRILTQTAPGVRVVVLTGFLDAAIEQAARQAGAAAVLHKGGRGSELAAVIRQVWAAAHAAR